MRQMTKKRSDLNDEWKERTARYHELLNFDSKHPSVDQKVLPIVLGWRPAINRKGLGLFSRKSGACKTRMIWQLIRDLHFSGVRWEATTATEIGHLYGSTFEARAAAEYRVERLCRVPLIFIDDLGMERRGTEIDAIAERIHHIVDARYASGLPLIWSCNKEPKELAAHLGERGAYSVRRLYDATTVFEVVRARGAQIPKKTGENSQMGCSLKRVVTR